MLKRQRASGGGKSDATAPPAVPTGADRPTPGPAPGAPGTSPPGAAGAPGRPAGDGAATGPTPAPPSPNRDAGADSAATLTASPPATGHDEQQVEPAAEGALAPVVSALANAVGLISAVFCSERPAGESKLQFQLWNEPGSGLEALHWAGRVLAVPPADLRDPYLAKIGEELRAGRLELGALLTPLDPQQHFFDRVLDAEFLRCVVLERGIRGRALYLCAVEEDTTRLVRAFEEWGHVLVPRGTAARRVSGDSKD